MNRFMRYLSALMCLALITTGLPVFAGPTEGTALGNLAAQMIADGTLADISDARLTLKRSFDIHRYDPPQI